MFVLVCTVGCSASCDCPATSARLVLRATWLPEQGRAAKDSEQARRIDVLRF